MALCKVALKHLVLTMADLLHDELRRYLWYLCQFRSLFLCFLRHTHPFCQPGLARVFPFRKINHASCHFSSVNPSMGVKNGSEQITDEYYHCLHSVGLAKPVIVAPVALFVVATPQSLDFVICSLFLASQVTFVAHQRSLAASRYFFQQLILLLKLAYFFFCYHDDTVSVPSVFCKPFKTCLQCVKSFMF